jgi:hypothetical protein
MDLKKATLWANEIRVTVFDWLLGVIVETYDGSE